MVLGPTGVWAQRSFNDLEYRVVRIDPGSPAHRILLPGDLIVGTHGERFKRENVSGKERQYRLRIKAMEPDRSMGRALEDASTNRNGLLNLTVKRGNAVGCVEVKLPFTTGFAQTYPWNCSKSKALANRIAADILKKQLPRKMPQLGPARSRKVFREDLYFHTWQALFLLNHDPSVHRERIDQVAKLVIDAIDDCETDNSLYGYHGRMCSWYLAGYGIFLAEYAMATGQEAKLRKTMDYLAAQILDARMPGGGLWGHTRSGNYGSTKGTFVAASCQLGLTLICLRKAGANLSDSVMARVMNCITSSIRRDSGWVDYQATQESRYLQPYNWSKILGNTRQTGFESMARQATVAMCALFSDRDEDVRAAFHYLKRQSEIHHSHGVAPELGIWEAARVMASYDQASCRKLLDDVRYRLNLSMTWNRGMYLNPYKTKLEKEYGHDTFRIGQFAPAMWGLLLTIPNKRLYLLSKVSSKAAPPVSTAASPASKDAPAVCNLTVGPGCVYYSLPEADQTWTLYRHDLSHGTPPTAIHRKLSEQPRAVVPLGDDVYYSFHDMSAWVWKGSTPVKLQNLSIPKNRKDRFWKFRRSNAHQFTCYNGNVYFASVGKKIPGGGALWETRGTRESTRIVSDNVNMVLGNQTINRLGIHAHADSVEVALGKLVFLGIDVDKSGAPVVGTGKLWVSDGTSQGTQMIADLGRMKSAPRVVAVYKDNMERGSFLGLEYNGKLYFATAKGLWQTDGSRKGTMKSPLAIANPNNFCVFQGKLAMTDFTKPQRVDIVLSDGTKGGTTRLDLGLKSITHLTPVGKKLFFVGNDARHGDELWCTDGIKENTRLILELRVGRAGGILNELVAMSGTLYFVASDDTHGSELRCSNGTPEGTLVADMIPGPEGAFPLDLRSDGKRLYFQTTANVGGKHLWCYPGASTKRHIVFAKHNGPKCFQTRGRGETQ